MKTYHLSENNSLMNQFIKEIRSVEIQKDSMRFRRNLQRIGEVMAYEISKSFDYTPEDVTTPLGVASVNIADENIVIASILRAGLPLHEGFLNVFDHAENCFVSAYRKYYDEEHFDIHIEYIASPDLNGKTVILVDPMLATGGSMELAYKALLTKGTPKKVYLASIVSSKQAVEYINKEITEDNVSLYVATIDPELNSHAYIIPGIGDAGDLAYGVKLP